MKFSAPLRAHEHSIKTNPKQTLITDAIILGIVVILLVLITIIVIVNLGFDILLLLPWILLGSIAGWLIQSIVKCAKNIKKMKNKKGGNE